MIVVSYFTPAYAEEASEMVRTVDAFGLRRDIQAVPDFGGWQKNTQHKARFMRAMLDEHDGEDVLWLDADARVRQYPALFDAMGADVAVHYRDGHELLSGTLWMRPSDVTRALCDAWIAACEERPNEWDQRALARVIDAAPGLRVYRLPAPYTAIFDAGMCPPGDVVVEHLQASRRLKQ